MQGGLIWSPTVGRWSIGEITAPRLWRDRVYVTAWSMVGRVSSFPPFWGSSMLELVFLAMIGFLLGFAVRWALKQRFGHKCPDCRQTVNRGAIVCHHCGAGLDRAVTSQAPPAVKSLGRIALVSFAAFIVLAIFAVIAGQLQG